MIAVIETCRRMLPTLSMVAKDGLAKAEERRPGTSSVTNGAMLRSCAAQPRLDARRRVCGRSAVGLRAFMSVRSSRGRQQLVLADRLGRRIRWVIWPLSHDQDAVGQGQHRLGLGRDHDDADPLLLQAAGRSAPRRPWRPHPCRASARQHQHLRRVGEPARQRHLLLVAAGERAQPRIGIGRRGCCSALDLALARSRAPPPASATARDRARGC